MRGKKTIQYIFFETLPAFIMGLLVFVLIILMFQVLRLTEFALIHGVDSKTIAQIIGFICISMLPILFPMSLLFAVILTYNRLSMDSEVIAFKSSGLSMWTLTAPAMILALLVGVISAQTSFEIAPWGNRQFEILYTQLGNTKAAATIKAGTFSEGFFDLVVYANEVDPTTNDLKNVFIYNERDTDSPLTIIAKLGQIIPDPDRPGHSVLLRLRDGDIHRKSNTHTKIKFNTYDLQLLDPVQIVEREKSPQSLTLEDLKALRLRKDLTEEQERLYTIEFHKRWAISVLCVVFAMIGVGLGIQTNRRQQKVGGVILCIAVIVAYWILYVALESFARNGQMPAVLALWTPNLIFGGLSIYWLKKNWN